MLKVSVDSLALDHIPYIDKKGRNATLIKQNAYLFTVDSTGVASRYPEKFEVLLPRDVTTPYAIGEYELHPSCVEVLLGKVAIRNVRLVALRSTLAK